MKETIEILASRLSYVKYSKEAITEILTEELSKLNPNRIDEERMKEIHDKNGFPLYDHSYTKTNVDTYNSTLPEPLVRLPEEMPEWFNTFCNPNIKWNRLIKDYGTPQKELPSVEELSDDLFLTLGNIPRTLSDRVAQHLIAKYKLDAKKDVFPFNLKKDDKVKYRGSEYKFECLDEYDPRIFLYGAGWVYAKECTLPHEPSIQDKCRKILGDTMYNELMEVKG